MLGAASGLTRVPTEDLQKALRSFHRGDLVCPFTIEGLTRVGLQHCASELLGLLRGVDERGTRAVLVAVIAERLAEERRRPTAGRPPTDGPGDPG